MNIARFVAAYECSLASLNAEAAQLHQKIARLEAKTLKGRLLTHRNISRHRLEQIRNTEMCPAVWMRTIVEPVHRIIMKQLGLSYRSEVQISSEREVTVRIYRPGATAPGLVLNFTLAEFCVLPSRERVQLEVVRTVVADDESIQERVPLTTPLSEIAVPLVAA